VIIISEGNEVMIISEGQSSYDNRRGQ
jgi:hypothetical protein